MFRNRTNSQKPAEGLLADFKAAFPGLSSSGRAASLTSAAEPDGLHTSTSLTDALDVAAPSTSSSRQHHGEEHDIKDLDPTPRANAVDQWRFTPSLLDPNSFAFSNFANQPPGYYTPTPGGTNTIYHPQAGDLHTPGFSLGLGTPLSMPTSDGAGHLNQTAAQQSFNPQGLNPNVFQNTNPFSFAPQPPHHSESFAPHQFSHQPQYEPYQSHHVDQSKMDEFSQDVEMTEQPAMETYPTPLEMQLRQVTQMPVDKYVSSALHTQGAPAAYADNSSFRYHVTLNAPTAMIKHADEIPVTYLNKGQAYSIKVVDTKPVNFNGVVPVYRTFVRISFEDEQQRQRPSQCWQLWKEGRGTSEAHQRGGRLQAVEYVDPNSSSGLDQSMRPRIELECASFDGFAVKWTPAPHGPSEFQLQLRFNFLSTDFSHSKGVKGIPVRLCAKTHLIENDVPHSPVPTSPEVCFCKVKLFRDHGAERKLSNDVAHVKKSIDKLKQQIAQVETGMKDFSKRKRSESGTKPGSSKPGKVQKHKRTWSMSSASDTGNNKSSHEDDLHARLQALQDMFTSTRPASILFLKGDEQDDPDLHPVFLSTEPVSTETLKRVDTGDSSTWEKASAHDSSIVSPTPSHHSLGSQDREASSGFQQPTPFQPNKEWQSQTATGDLHPGSSQQHFSPSDSPTKVQKVPHEGSPMGGWIEAVGVDYSYQPPPERVIKPVACFYIQARRGGEQPKDNYYRAIYLMQRTLSDLVNAIALKSNLEPSKVLRTTRINQKGLNILMDDESVTELPEGQDMVADFHEIRPNEPMKREWDSGPTDIQVDGEVDTAHTVQSEGYELRLLY